MPGRRVVFVTQGTVATDPDQLLRPALAGLAGLDVLVVAVTGDADHGRRPRGSGRVSSAILGLLPATARVAPFIPYGPVLRRAAAVTNGGFGGVQLAHRPISHVAGRRVILTV